MKKVIPAAIVLVALVGAAAFFLLKEAGELRTKAIDLAPADTIFFIHLPNLPRSAERWPQTALARIGAEPEVQAFLAKPRTTIPQIKFWAAKLAQLLRVEPREAFLAITSLDGAMPRFLAGFRFSGRKSEVEELLTDMRAEWKRAWPTGKSDLMLHGRTTIETFTLEDVTMGEAIRDDWYFAANDLELLRRTIDAAQHGLGAHSLAANELFQKSTAKLPADGEAMVFAQMRTISERLVSLLAVSAQTINPKQVEDLKKVQAMAWGLKFDGEQMRDTLFVLSPGNVVAPPLARSAQAFSGPPTVFTYAATMPKTAELSDASLGAFRLMAPGFLAFENALAEQGLKLNDFEKAFGPEFGAVIDWEEDAGQPSALLALDVRDAALAQKFVDVFTGGLPGSLAWGRTESEGVTIYQSPAKAGWPTITPSAALMDRFLVIGFSQNEVAAALDRLKSGKAVIANRPAYVEAVKGVREPTSGFGYLDLKVVFERSYGMLRPFIAMSLAFTPDSGRYVDPGKLPATPVISKHLTPSVYSQSAIEEGTLVESVGTLTFNQVLVATLGGAVTAAFPMIENMAGQGAKLNPSVVPPSGKAPASTSSEKSPRSEDLLPTPIPVPDYRPMLPPRAQNYK